MAFCFLCYLSVLCFYFLDDLLTIVTNMRRLTGPPCQTHPSQCSASFVIQTQLQQFAKDFKTLSFLPLFIFQHLSSNEPMLCWNTCLQDVHSLLRCFTTISAQESETADHGSTFRKKSSVCAFQANNKFLLICFDDLESSFFFFNLKLKSTIYLKNCRLGLQIYSKLHRF